MCWPMGSTRFRCSIAKPSTRRYRRRAAIKDPKTGIDVPKYTSYVNVQLNRAQFLEFLKTHYPALIDGTAAQKKAIAAAEKRRMARELEARIAAGECGTREEEAKRLGLGERSSVFDWIWKKAHEMAGVKAKVGARPGSRKPPQ